MKLITRIEKSIALLQELGDNTLSAFLREEGFAENGFRFMQAEGSCLYFSVPEQDKSTWYKEDGWPSDEKKQIADTIIEKYGLELFSPPENYKISRFLPEDAPHNFEFHAKLQDKTKDALIAHTHPLYLQFRKPGNLKRNDLAEIFEDVCKIYLLD